MNNIEKETIINFNEAEKEASVYTFNQKILRKMQEYAEKFPDDCRLIHTGQRGEREYLCPKSWVKFRSPNIISPSRREAMKARFMAIRAENFRNVGE